MSHAEMSVTPQVASAPVAEIGHATGDIGDFLDFISQQSSVSETVGAGNLPEQNIGSETVTLIQQVQAITADTAMAQKLELTRKYFETISDFISSGDVGCCGGSESSEAEGSGESNKGKEGICSCNGRSDYRGRCMSCGKRKPQKKASPFSPQPLRLSLAA